jgi:hypothetical protein
MLFLLRSAFLGAIFYGLIIWAFGVAASWTWYIVTACVIALFLFVEAVSMTTLKWAAFLAIINNEIWDEDFRQ